MSARSSLSVNSHTAASLRRCEQLYGPDSVFTADEQAAMRKGYSTAERLEISGHQFGRYPQAISWEHAAKLDALNFPGAASGSAALNLLDSGQRIELNSLRGAVVIK